ncbi:MAG: RnfABCDGE type electron transport complex subunit D [Clostridia bacterium]|nr:RnfABCDGE type electron transport complex subunit D [Clostridia bacterium]
MEKLAISSSPHLRGTMSVTRIMATVLICLLPAVVASIVLFGWYSLLLEVFCVVVCVLLEFICRKVMKRQQTVKDLSAAVTGLLLALTLPPYIGLQYALVGCIAAIVVVKQMFGGIGHNFINPALGGRIIMTVSFPTAMTTWFYDGKTTATPLSGGGASITDMLLGRTGGCIGETCAIALIIGGIALIALGIIKVWIPLSYLGTVALFSLIAGKDIPMQLLSGGLLIGAFFMATDYTTSPLTTRGKIIYGIGCGLLTCVIRFYASLPGGVSYSIVLMNIITPLIDRYVRPKSFGEVRQKKPKAEKEAAK